MRTIALLGFPLDVFRRSRQHTEALLREFAFLVDGGGDNADLPRQLLDTVKRVRTRAAGLNTGAANVLESALARGDETIDFEIFVPLSIAKGANEFSGLLDRVDAYCEDGHLLTLATSPELQRFRHWYLGEITAQVDGCAPVAWSDFED